MERNWRWRKNDEVVGVNKRKATNGEQEGIEGENSQMYSI